MRRTSWFRSLASLLALWLPLIAGEPGLLQPCPMHGAGRAAMASLRGERARDDHAHHMAAAASKQASQSSAPAHDHHRCTCIDCGAVSTGAFVAPTPATAELVVAEYAVQRAVPSVASLARPAPEYSRPYTTGPPPRA